MVSKSRSYKLKFLSKRLFDRICFSQKNKSLIERNYQFANQNHSRAHCKVGIIYSTGEFISRDINKSIHYFTLAANQNHSNAWFELGIFHYRDTLVSQDMDKYIHYIMQIKNQNNSDIENNHGKIYSEGEFISQNINKFIYYITIAANLNNSCAQYILGLTNFLKICKPHNKMEGVNLIILSSENGF